MKGRLLGSRFSEGVRYSENFTPPRRFQSDEHTLALYHFDEGSGDVLKDSSGNGHHGKIVGAKWVRVDEPTPTEPDGPFALAFDGRSSVVCPVEIPRGSAYTVELWAQFDDMHDGRWGRLLFELVTPDEVAAVVGWNIPDYLSRGLQMHHRRTPDETRRLWDARSMLSKGRLTHVAVVSESGREWFFVDGKVIADFQVREQTGANRRTDGLPPGLSLGDFRNHVVGPGSSEPLVGRISEVRVSTTARYRDEFSPRQRFENDDDTLALYHFDEGRGDVLVDSSGNGNDAKIVGAKWGRVDEPARKPNLALELDGIDDHIVIPTDGIDVGGGFTIEGWIRIDAPREAANPVDNRVKVLGWTGPVGFELLQLRPPVGDNGNIVANYRYGDGKFLNARSGQEEYGRRHVAIVRNRDTFDLYLDGADRHSGHPATCRRATRSRGSS